jgi:hypothetical protein
MQLLIDPGGTVRCVYAEAIDLTALGTPSIRRASHVEPDEHGQWWSDLSPVGGPRLGPFPSRTPALDAEHAWLEANWLPGRHAGPTI